jgi:hypothetical protein
VEGRAAGVAFRFRLAVVAADPREFGQGQLKIAFAALTELFELGQVDRQVMRVEGQHARHVELRALVDQRALGQPEDDDIGIVGAQELALFRGRGDDVASGRAGVDEDAGQVAAFVFAFLDPQRHAVAQIGKLADLDRCAERTGAQLEPQPFIIVAGIGLDIADDREVQRGERDART